HHRPEARDGRHGGRLLSAADAGGGAVSGAVDRADGALGLQIVAFGLVRRRKIFHRGGPEGYLASMGANRMNKLITASIAALAMGVSMAAAEPIKVGMITTLSGGGAGLGIDARDGFMLA